ncbi:MAG: HRDC domain-containing protein [Isosphaeraceae bacterium]
MTDPTPESWIIDPEGLRTLADHLRAEARFAFDTEFVSEDTFEPVLCLVQVATRDRLAVIDPMAVGDMRPFWNVVNDPAIEVVMHAAGEDLRIDRFQTGRLPDRVVDVQLAAGMVGYPYPMSLGNLVDRILGVTVSTGETRTDWRRRPLSPEQLRYALDDVRHLLVVADQLGDRLAKLGRTAWADQEYHALVESISHRDDHSRWRRLPGLHHLNRRGLEIARRLVDWRRDDARRTNRPLRAVLKDDLLVGIAKRQPSSRRDLEALRDFNRHHLASKAGEILDVITEAQRVAVEDLPEHSLRHDEGPGLSMVVSLLAATLNHCSAREQVAASLVGTVADLKDLVRWHVQGEPEDRRPDLAQGWRGEVCGRALMDVLSGRRTLRIVDPLADVPVALDDAPDDEPASPKGP